MKISVRFLPLLTGLLCLFPTLSQAEREVALFVGNSFCDYNVLNKQVEAMYVAEGKPALFKRETVKGSSWKRHWEEGQAQDRIRGEEDWDFVILQNHSRSTLDDRADFDVYGRKFIDLVKSKDAEPVLYMTWARAGQLEDQAVITEAYSSLGHRNGIKVAPVGLAFEKWITEHPDVPLHIHDDNHPTGEGSYLAACVIYATTSGKSPVGLPNVIEGANWVTKGNRLADLTPEMAKDLQETAWAVVQNYSPEKYASETPLAPPAKTPAADGAGIMEPAGSDIRINFGGSQVPGWNKVGAAEMQQAMPLVSADGKPTQYSLRVVDGFVAHENPDVVAVPLEGDAAAFEGAKSATLFLNRKEGDATGSVELTLSPEKTYQFRVWASRSAGGRRWGKYTVAGAESESQFLAAGGDYGKEGNASETLLFSNVRPDGEGTVSLSVDFPAEGEKKTNLGDFVYLTGLIVSEN